MGSLAGKLQTLWALSHKASGERQSTIGSRFNPPQLLGRRWRSWSPILFLMVVIASSVTESPALASSAPGAPTNVAATASDGAALVSWTAPSGNGAPITSYTVTVETTGGSLSQISQVSCATGPVTDALITGLADGQSYQFDVFASNANGGGSTSGWATATPGSGAAPVVAISACPTALVQGQSTPITASASYLPPGDYLEIGEVSYGPPLSSNSIMGY